MIEIEINPIEPGTRNREAMKPWTGDVELKPLGNLEVNPIDAKIREIDDWLRDRPSATMDPRLDDRKAKIKERAVLKSLKRKTVRRETKMMAAQQMSEFDAGDLPW